MVPKVKILLSSLAPMCVKAKSLGIAYLNLAPPLVVALIAIDEIDPFVQATEMFVPAITSTLALATIGSLFPDPIGVFERLQLLTTVAVKNSGAEAEPASVDAVAPSIAAISIKKKK